MLSIDVTTDKAFKEVLFYSAALDALGAVCSRINYLPILSLYESHFESSRKKHPFYFNKAIWEVKEM